jgi:transcription elongation GreA/GreB family factor
MSIKQKLHNLCHSVLLERVQAIQSALKEATDAGNNETKSTSGDKHETGRAMAQLEQEKNAKQLQEALKLLKFFATIPSDKVSDRVSIGSLVKTNKGNFYISVGLGKLELEGMEYYAISAASPMGKALMGKLEGENVSLNGNQLLISRVE